MNKTRLIQAGLSMMMIFSIAVLHAAGKYTIVYESAKVRGDGGKNYYVLIESVNLKNDGFKKEIEQMVCEMAPQKGRNITIDFFDDRKLLEDYYQSQRKSVTKSENRTEVWHHIARFLDRKGVNPILMFIPGMNTSNTSGGGNARIYTYYFFNPYK